MENERVEIVITETKLSLRYFPSYFDPADDVMFIPLRAPGRSNEEPDYISPIETDMKTFANYDLTPWKNKKTRKYICRKVVEHLIDFIVE